MTETQADNQLPLTRIQKLIGKYMLQSKQTKPTGYVRIRADLTGLTKMRRAYCRQVKTRVTTNDFFIHAIARAIKEYPLLAATIDAEMENLVISEKVGVGFAVAAPQGLVVPVVRNMNGKTLAQTAIESDDLLKRARANKLVPDDFDGANVVLSGLGMYGIETFYAISPPLSTGIVSIGNFEDDFIERDGEFVMRKMMYVALAFDHRIMDERYAAKFLKRVVDLLENPTELIDDPDTNNSDDKKEQQTQSSD
ncbi:MAG: 2-oxo acid dehydrogenase subunit E2 [Planctomycetota bacterium]